MSWFPVDDALHSHPKARKAGLEALGLWVVAGSHCMAYLTDGFVAEWFVKEKPRGMLLATRLVDAGLWYVGVNADGEEGFWFHDWKPECTKEHVLASREKARLRKAKSRESQRDIHSDTPSDGTRDETRESLGWPTQPNPTQISNGHLGGESHGESAADSNAPPPDRCPKHANDPDPPPCGSCRRARLAAEAKTEHLANAAAERRAEFRAELVECTHCDENGWIDEGVGGLRRCKNHDWESTTTGMVHHG